jgi:hypothetical protein
MTNNALFDASGKVTLLETIAWTEAEPGRLARDIGEVSAFAPLLAYVPPNLNTDRGCLHGGWIGELPRWPFSRAQPEGLDALIGLRGLQVVMIYSAAHPMVAPTIYPTDPKPTLWEQTQTAWHVAPGGSLCLLQSEGDWQPEASITDLLAKAAGWRIEYALMKAELLERMTTSGIVSDDSIDYLVEEAARRIAAGS